MPSKFLGTQLNVLDKPKLFSFFFGLAVGCILGSIPLAIPGLSMPIKLGLAGGPIIGGYPDGGLRCAPTHRDLYE